jgi:hypothetical protein
MIFSHEEREQWVSQWLPAWRRSCRVEKWWPEGLLYTLSTSMIHGASQNSDDLR